MRLIDSQRWVQDYYLRRTTMCAVLNEFIESKSYSIKEYNKFLFDAGSVWPCSFKQYSINQYLNMSTRTLKDNPDRYYAFYSSPKRTTLDLYREYNGTITSRGIREDIFNKCKDFMFDVINCDEDELDDAKVIIFFEDADEVRKFYNSVVNIGSCAYSIMEMYYAYFAVFEQRRMNYFAKKDSFFEDKTTRAAEFVSEMVEEDLKERKGFIPPPETKVDRILKDCFIEFEKYFVRASMWPSISDYGNERSRMIIDLTKRRG